MRRSTSLSIVALLIVSIGALAEPSSFSFGTIHPSCAPWDGPAVEIRLTRQRAECKDTAGPFLSFAVWRGLPIHAGQSVKVAPGSDAAYAALCAKEGDCKRAESATIVFDKYDGEAGATGHYELKFKDGETMKGAFEAKRCRERVVCG